MTQGEAFYLISHYFYCEADQRTIDKLFINRLFIYQ